MFVFNPHAIITMSFPGRERAWRRYEIRWNYREAQRLIRMQRHPQDCQCPGHRAERRRAGTSYGVIEWGFGWGTAEWN